MDSMLLLHLMSQLVPHQIRAIYINHQLQEANAAWADFVQAYCTAHQIPVLIETVQVRAGNLEQQARDARYQAFQQHLRVNEVLVLAHHQQDQAETVMLRLLSGAGIHGLAAMRVVDQREQMTLWRPLLELSREQICQWVDQLELPYVDDPSNMDTHYDRAWCRHELWQILQSRFPKMQQAVARSSYLMQDAEDILEEVLQQDLQQCGDETVLDILAIAQLSAARRRQLLSSWMRGEEQYRPSFDMVERLQNEVLDSRVDSQAALHWNSYYYVRYQQKIYRLPKAIYLAAQRIPLAVEMRQFQLQQQFELPSGQYQIASTEIGLSFDLMAQDLQLRPRLGGEKIHLYGRVGVWPLKKAIQEAQIFPWMRHTIQILMKDNVMLGVFTPKGFWLAHSDYCEIGGWQPKRVSSLSKYQG